MLKLGRKFEFYFGSGVYVPYMVWEIDTTNKEEKDWVITLLTADKYAGCDREMKIKGAELFNKRKIYDWVSRLIH